MYGQGAETKKKALLDKIEKQGGERSLGDCLLLDQYNKEIKQDEKQLKQYKLRIKYDNERR